MTMEGKKMREKGRKTSTLLGPGGSKIYIYISEYVSGGSRELKRKLR